MGARYVDLAVQEFPDIDVSALRRALREVASGEATSFRRRYMASKTAPRWRELWVTPLPIADATYLAVLHSDVLAFEEGRCSTALESALAAQEEEHGRNAVELHDSTIQHLVVLGLGVAQLRRLVGLSRKSKEVLEDMANAVQTLFKDMRVHAHLMSSTNLDRDGFRTAAKALVEGFEMRSGLKTSFQAAGALSALSGEVQRAALRVIQQALSDAYRRTDPGPVSVEVSHRSDVLTVRVTDGGKGAGTVAAAATGAGSAGPQARVLHLGGVLDTSSEASITAVEARIPTALRSSAPG